MGIASSSDEKNGLVGFQLDFLDLLEAGGKMLVDG